MTEKRFDEIVEQRLEAIKKTLIEKGKEYRRGNDPLHNFKRASKVLGVSKERALWGFAGKHLISFMDILDDIDGKNDDHGLPNYPSKAVLNEKIGDLINYLILCEACISETIDANESNKRFYENNKEFGVENPMGQLNIPEENKK